MQRRQGFSRGRTRKLAPAERAASGCGSRLRRRRLAAPATDGASKSTWQRLDVVCNTADFTCTHNYASRIGSLAQEIRVPLHFTSWIRPSLECNMVSLQDRCIPRSKFCLCRTDVSLVVNFDDCSEARSPNSPCGHQ